jgi:hypothetical protein
MSIRTSFVIGVAPSTAARFVPQFLLGVGLGAVIVTVGERLPRWWDMAWWVAWWVALASAAGWVIYSSHKSLEDARRAGDVAEMALRRQLVAAGIDPEAVIPPAQGRHRRGGRRG